MFCLGMLKRWMCLKLELERRNSEEFETWPETPEYVSSKVGKLKIFRGPSNRSRISPVPPISLHLASKLCTLDLLDGYSSKLPISLG